jgi:sigma-B regulation protein RsbU (phosphoserine phosphatase)
MSIRSKLILSILVPLLAVFAFVLGEYYVTGRARALAQARQRLGQLAAHRAARIDRSFSQAEQAGQSIANVLAEGEGVLTLRQASQILLRTLARNAQLDGACIAFEPYYMPDSRRFARYVYRPGGVESPPSPLDDGPPSGPAPPPEVSMLRPLWQRARDRMARPRAVDLHQLDPNFLESAWYIAAWEGDGPVWSEPIRARPDGPMVCRCAVPLNRDEQFIGVVFLDVALDPVRRYVLQSQPEAGYAMLVSAAGEVVAHPDLDGAGPTVTLAELSGPSRLPASLDALPAGEGGVIEDVVDPRDGRASWAVVSPVNSSGWRYLAMVPRDSLLDPLMAGLARHAATMLLALALVSAIVLLVSIRITGPIRRLLPVVRRMERGDLDVEARDIPAGDEIGEFAQTFNAMVVRLRAHVDALTQETAARQAVESELRVARDIQASLLPGTFPPFPHRKEFDLHAVNVAARTVAGDFFDFFFVEENVLALMIADVSGKGVPAALYMAVTRTVLRNQASAERTPGEVLGRVNQVIARENERNMFTTAFLAYYHTDTGRLDWSSAGHNPPIIGGNGQSPRLLDADGGLMLGVFCGEEYPTCRETLSPGESLVLYTDGVTEAMDERDEQFGLQRLQRVVAGNGDIDPGDLDALVVQAVNEHRRGQQQDDVTLLVLRRNH